MKYQVNRAAASIVLFDILLICFTIRAGASSPTSGAKQNMGQAIRIMKYDREANEKNAIEALSIQGQPLLWHRLDDGVMGGMSETNHARIEDGKLHFYGEINTSGGGFCSIRSPISEGVPQNTEAIKIRLRGDGKTYKLLLSNGMKSKFGPSKMNPSWQCDIPTSKENIQDEEIIIPLTSLKPSWGGGPMAQPSAEERSLVRFNIDSIREIGFMLSLKLSDGSNNPVETFGEGIFSFSLEILSIELILAANDERPE